MFRRFSSARNRLNKEWKEVQRTGVTISQLVRLMLEHLPMGWQLKGTPTRTSCWSCPGPQSFFLLLQSKHWTNQPLWLWLTVFGPICNLFPQQVIAIFSPFWSEGRRQLWTVARRHHWAAGAKGWWWREGEKSFRVGTVQFHSGIGNNGNQAK